MRFRSLLTEAGVFALALTLGLGSARPLEAQTAGGVIQGTVSDAQGGVLPGATLTATNVDTGLVRTVASEADGGYRLAALPPGRYDLTAELQGFATTELKDIVLTVGLESRRDMTLGIGNLQETVTVAGEAQLVETTRAEVSGVITQKQIDTLPIEGRSAVSLALLLPGTGTDATRARRPGASVGIGAVSLAGTNYIVDNMNNMTLRTGDSREDIPQAAVQEFRVIVSQYPAEFGGRVGGVINLVTKSGSNLFSGEAFEFFRDKSMNRVDMFQQEQHDLLGTAEDDFRRDQFGVSLGGPVVRNRVHFFTSLEHKDSQEFFTVNTGKPELYSSLEGTFQGGSDATAIFGRGDFEATSNQHVFFRYFKQDATYFADGAGGRNVAFSAGDVTVPGFSYIAGHTWIVSPKVLNEFTGMYAESFQDTTLNEEFTPTQYLSAGSPRYNFPSMSFGASPGTHFRNVYRQFRNALSISSGNHVWKFGGGIQWIPLYMANPGNPNGTWTFSTDQYFNPSDPAFDITKLTGATQFASSLPIFYPIENSHTYELYVQDTWTPRPNVTLNVGLRYDLQTIVWNEEFTQARYPRPLPYVDFASRGDDNNVAPRAGIVWDLHNNGRSVVRGGYGVIYTNVQHNLVAGEGSAFQQYSITIRNPRYPDPYQGRDPLSFVSTAPPNITIGANNLVNAPAQTLNGGFSRDLGAGAAIHVDAVYTRIDDLPTGVPINEPDPVTRQVPLADWGHITQTQPIGAYRYRALLARLDKRVADRGLYTISYTLSKQDAHNSVTDTFNRDVDAGPADNDRLHNLTASGSAFLPWDVTLSGVWTFRTARPFSALAGRDLNGDGANTDFVPGTTKNQGNRGLDLSLVNDWRAQNNLAPIGADQIDGDTYSRLDIRASKAFTFGRQRLEIIGQVFNLLGRDNLSGIGASSQTTNALSDSFGRILTAQPRQQAELGIRFVW